MTNANANVNHGADGPTVLVALLAACAILSIAWAQPKTIDDVPPDSFPGLARDLLPLCERAEALRQEADEGDAPPAEMRLLCDTADTLWRVYHELKGAPDDAP